MNDLINTTGDAPLTMSSREIAELCEKRHDNVVRDIEKMFADLKFEASDFGGSYKDVTGRSLKEYRLPKDLTVTLITGYRADLRYKVVKRLEELEGKQAPVNVRDPATLTTIALQLIEVNKELEQRAVKAEAQVESARPKTNFYDQFADADGLYTLQNAGRILTGSPNKFIGQLKQGYLFYQGGNLVPKVQYREQGLFEVKVTIVDDKARPQTFMTPKGIQHFAKKLGKTGLDLFGRAA